MQEPTIVELVPLFLRAAPLLLALTLITASSHARAQAQPVATTEPVAPPVAREGKWYGWQTLAVDGASLFLGLALSQTLDVEPDALGVAAATWYGASAVAVPAVHHAHGNWPIGLASFGYRMLAPPVAGFFGLLIGCTANREFDGSCARPSWAAGTMVGLAGAAAFDAVVAREYADAERQHQLWYGWQILMLDAIGYGFGAYFAASNPRTKDGEKIPPSLGLWVGAYTLGFITAPITHFVHGEVGKGFGSLGLRLFVGPMGALFGLIGYCSATSGSDGCMEVGAVWGLLGGGLTISLLDALVLAYEPAPARPKYTTSASLGPGTLVISGYF